MRKDIFKQRFVSRKGVSEVIVEEIMQAINTGELKAGDKLPSMSELARRLNVAPGSVREALKRMETLGFVMIKQGKGIFVKQADISSIAQGLGTFLKIKKTDFLHLMQARKTLENATVKMAAEKASEEDIVQLKKIVAKMKRNINNPDEFIQQDLAFHMKLAEISKNPIYSVFLNSIRNLFLEEQKAVVKLPDAAQRANDYHTKIYQCVKKHSPVEAIQVMTSHLKDIEKAILKYENSNNREP